MDSVGADVEEFVVAWFRVPGEHALVFGGLVGDYLFGCEFCVFSI